MKKVRDIIIRFLYKAFLKPILFRIDPEQIHDRMIKVGVLLGRFGFTRKLTGFLFGYTDPSLHQTIAGISFKNPIGLSAGFDKNVELTDILPFVGFGFAEVGSVTGEKCSGNLKPRLWRIPEEKSIRVNYGLMNNGAEVIANRLQKKKFLMSVGISIAMTNCEETVETEAAIRDYLKVYRAFSNIGDYITVNISCPNTFGGQPFTDPDRLDFLLRAITRERDVRPIFIKLSPDLDLDQLVAIANISEKHGIDGFICSNLVKKHDHGKGGLSGKPVQSPSEAHLKYLYRRFKKEKVLIGCGGVFTAEDAYRKIKAGASLIQMITGMIYDGPQVIGEINRGLAEFLKRDSFDNISDAVGKDVM